VSRSRSCGGHDIAVVPSWPGHPFYRQAPAISALKCFDNTAATQTTSTGQPNHTRVFICPQGSNRLSVNPSPTWPCKPGQGTPCSSDRPNPSVSHQLTQGHRNRKPGVVTQLQSMPLVCVPRGNSMDTLSALLVLYADQLLEKH
jgi:hypothetical protein